MTSLESTSAGNTETTHTAGFAANSADALSAANSADALSAANSADALSAANSDIARLTAEWGLLAAAGVAALGGLGRMLGGDGLGERFGLVTLTFLAVAGGLCAVRYHRFAPAGSEPPESQEPAGLRERQRMQASRLDELTAALPLLLPENEGRHLVNLSDKLTENYHGGPSLREELRRLRGMGLIVRKGDRGIADLHDGLTFDLADVVEPTEAGRLWAVRLRAFRHAVDESPCADSRTV